MTSSVYVFVCVYKLWGEERFGIKSLPAPLLPTTQSYSLCMLSLDLLLNDFECLHSMIDSVELCINLLNAYFT